MSLVYSINVNREEHLIITLDDNITIKSAGKLVDSRHCDADSQKTLAHDTLLYMYR